MTSRHFNWARWIRAEATWIHCALTAMARSATKIKIYGSHVTNWHLSLKQISHLHVRTGLRKPKEWWLPPQNFHFFANAKFRFSSYSANRAKDWTRSSVSCAEPRYVCLVGTIPEFISMHLSLRGMWLAAAFTRTSFTILQDNSNNMAWISGQFFVVKRACIFNSLNSMRSVFISVVFRLYLAKIVAVKTQPMCGRCHNSGGLLKFSEF